MLQDFKIPIPPLAIQQEIVKILDTFTTLEAELEARKKQYEYYREELLTFKEFSSGKEFNSPPLEGCQSKTDGVVEAVVS